MANAADLGRKYFRMAPLMPASLSHIYDNDLFRIFINGIIWNIEVIYLKHVVEVFIESVRILIRVIGNIWNILHWIFRFPFSVAQ